MHVDHGLRPESSGEADVVRSAADRFGAAFRAETVELAPGPNLEARAREARYRVLPSDVATGHTADDQAETMLINLMRGAGRDGLAAMAPGYRHPILALRRSETRQLCADLRLAAVEDPTNFDPVHLRNRVRHELLPLLCRLSGRDVVPVLTRQADLLRDESELLDRLAAELDAGDARALAEAPRALARRAVRRWLSTVQDHPPPAATVERVLAVARGEAIGTDVGGGRSARRTAGRLRVVSPQTDEVQDQPPDRL